MSSEVYQLDRDERESIRLNTQHGFIKDLNLGRLVHDRIPQHQIRAVADVATGTGVWLQDYASQVAGREQTLGEGCTFVGFDISPLQFPTRQDAMQFVVHDMTRPFPKQYHGVFDLVNIRLVVAGIPIVKLKDVLVNILQILRPGGYLQWLDTDASCVCSKPFNAAAQAFILKVLENKAGKGLSLCFAQDVLRELVLLTTLISPNSRSIELPISNTRVNLVTRSACPYRLLKYDIVRTETHPSASVRAAGHQALCSAYTSMLTKSSTERRAAIDSEEVLPVEKATLLAKVADTERVLEDFKSQMNTFQWEWGLTWVVAQKASFANQGEDWLNAGKEEL